MKGRQVPSPFELKDGREQFAAAIVAQRPADLIVSLVSLALIYDLGRVEAAIRATYTAPDASKIIQGVNLALSLLPSVPRS